MKRVRDERGNAAGDTMMSCGCLIMLVPILLILIFLLISVLGAMLGIGE